MTNNNIDSNEPFGEDLKRKIWITKGTRFNAHQRLMTKHNWSVAATAFSSAYVLIVSIICFTSFSASDSLKHNILSFSAIALSIFILVLRLLEASKSYELKAKEFHDCARRLSGLYDRLAFDLTVYNSNATTTEVSNQISKIASEYNSILDQCNENHKMIDLELFKTQHEKDFSGENLNKVSIKFKNWIQILPYLSLIIIPPVLIILLMIFL
jgi:hypothetical protein